MLFFQAMTAFALLAVGGTCFFALVEGRWDLAAFEVPLLVLLVFTWRWLNSR